MSNFSPYLSIPSFAAFAPIAESAEKILSIDPSFEIGRVDVCGGRVAGHAVG